VHNNPLRYTDPSGHAPCYSESSCKALNEKLGLTSTSSKNGKFDVESIQSFLDYAGLVPGIGELADGANAIIYLSQGEYLYALLSTGSMIPILGWVVSGAKVTLKTGKAVSNSGDILKKADNVVCNCFTSGTKVLTDEGEKPIEEIEVGDKVLAKSDETGEVAYKEVVGLFQKQADEIYKVYVGDEVIEATAEHPFWLDGKGWTEVKDMNVGNLLVSSDGTKLAIDKIEKEPREATVYNFEVADFQSYFVSNLGVWVHNCAVNVGKSKNNMKYDPDATGEHSTFKRDPQSGEITNWQRWYTSDPRNPNPFTPGERYDGKGAGHFNKVTGEMVDTPHVNDPKVPGGVRKPYPWEIPGVHY